MKQSKFSRLKVGDKVTLATNGQAYGYGYPSVDGRVFVPSGAEGTVGSVKVPSVTYRRGQDPKGRLFVCVDFPKAQNLVDVFDKDVAYDNPHGNTFRVAAYPEDLCD